jgi:6-phosphogluconolactonase
MSVRCKVASDIAPDTKYIINVIPKNGDGKHPVNGVPSVMGAHLMASGFVAPVSTSSGAGMNVYPPEVAYYSKPGEGINVMLHATATAAASSLAKIVAEASEAAIKAKGSFTLVLSGGSLPSSLSTLLTYKGNIQWDKFHILFVDERNVPHSSDESNLKAAREALLSKVPIPVTQVYGILEGQGVREAAVHYEGQLVGLPTSVLPRNAQGFPVFDLMLLGVGPDGHVASLFPHRSSLTETKRWVLPIDNSPKPPPERITFTLPVINAAKEVVFVALGVGKAEVVQRTLEVQALPGALPAQLVRPESGKLRWLLDVSSAQNLDIANWDKVKQFPRSQ